MIDIIFIETDMLELWTFVWKIYFRYVKSIKCILESKFQHEMAEIILQLKIKRLLIVYFAIISSFFSECIYHVSYKF